MTTVRTSGQRVRPGASPLVFAASLLILVGLLSMVLTHEGLAEDDG
jgi:hypothetical protein